MCEILRNPLNSSQSGMETEPKTEAKTEIEAGNTRGRSPCYFQINTIFDKIENFS